MGNWASDQAEFMRAGGQTVGVPNHEQVMLYSELVDEEAGEVGLASMEVEGSSFPTCGVWENFDGDDISYAVGFAAELADGAVDTIVVCIGLLHSMGIDPDKAWAEVHRSNMAKIDPATGKVLKRNDGKIQKPEGWTPPDMKRVVREAWGLDAA